MSYLQKVEEYIKVSDNKDIFIHFSKIANDDKFHLKVHMNDIYCYLKSKGISAKNIEDDDEVILPKKWDSYYEMDEYFSDSILVTVPGKVRVSCIDESGNLQLFCYSPDKLDISTLYPNHLFCCSLYLGDTSNFEILDIFNTEEFE